MKIAVLGTGMVGTIIADKLLALGHDLRVGSRSATSEAGQRWLKKTNHPQASVHTFEEAAATSELIFNATKGEAALEVLGSVGAGPLKGKIVIDISNPLDFSQGMPPRLSVCNDSSLGETLQKNYPATRFVKTLNTVAAPVMVDPARLGQPSAVFVSGNDSEAKAFVQNTVLKEWFGWEQIVDLGDITTARGTEMFLALWVRLWATQKTTDFNIALVSP